jgi:hypothetical protein
MKVAWEQTLPDEAGRYERRARVEIPGLPVRELVELLGFRVDELRVVPVAKGPVRSGMAVSFRAEAVPPLPADALCEWTITAAGKEVSRTTGGPLLNHSFPAAGKFSLLVRAGRTDSAPIDVAVYRVSVVDGLGRELQECRLGLPGPEAFDSRGRLRDEALHAAPERIRILVEDPAPEHHAGVMVSTCASDGGPVNPPIAFALSDRLSREFLLLGDRVDDLAESGGRADDAPEDPTLQAVPRGRLVVVYRGAPAATVGVGPMILHEIPVRLTFVGPGLPPLPELERAVERRLAQANGVWEPFGRRFIRARVTRMDGPRHLLLVRGRSAGQDAQGHPSRAGALFDGREVSFPSAWQNGAGETAHRILRKAGEAWRIDLFEKFLAGDHEAVVLRVHRPDGTAALLEPLAGGRDVAQSTDPLPFDFSDGCEISPQPRFLSLEEAATLVGGKPPAAAGLDFFVFPELRALQARPPFKVYPEGTVPAPLAGSGLLSWKIMDGSGAYPYALARAIGELLLPLSARPAVGDTLFADPLSEAPGVAAHKRVTATTGLKRAGEK